MVHEVELARLALRRDALIAEYAGDIAWWHAVQAAGLAVTGLAAVGFASASISAHALVGSVAVSGFVVALASRRLDARKDRFHRDMDRVEAEHERLKEERGHL